MPTARALGPLSTAQRAKIGFNREPSAPHSSNCSTRRDASGGRGVPPPCERRVHGDGCSGTPLLFLPAYCFFPTQYAAGAGRGGPSRVEPSPTGPPPKGLLDLHDGALDDVLRFLSIQDRCLHA